MLTVVAVPKEELQEPVLKGAPILSQPSKSYTRQRSAIQVLPHLGRISCNIKASRPGLIILTLIHTRARKGVLSNGVETVRLHKNREVTRLH